MLKTVTRSKSLLLICLLSAGAVSFSHAQEPLTEKQGTFNRDKSLIWFDAKLLTVEGRGWSKVASPYDRLPAKAKEVARQPVWNLSHDSAGMCVRFRTNASKIVVNWTLIDSTLAMPHMPATGVSGVDLYVKDDQDQWRWAAIGKPSRYPINEVTLVDGIESKTREYMLYLPLYNGVKSVAVGIPPKFKMAQGTPRVNKAAQPLLFWGTSITQGGCASRPGMVHTAILGRRLNRPVINLGFSGNGKMETELAEIVAEIDAGVFIIDCLPNMDASLVSKRTIPLVKAIRQEHPTSPILLVEDRTYSNSFLIASRQQRNDTNRQALRSSFDRLVAAGDENLYYLEGSHLLGADGEATVDSSHPTDLGFLRMADAFEEKLVEILK